MAVKKRKKSVNRKKNSSAKSDIKIPAKLSKFLGHQKAKFEVVEHRTVYTTYDTAMTLKVDPKTVAKTLLLKADRNLVMAVLPGNKNLDFGKIKKSINALLKEQGSRAAKKISLAREKIIENKFTKSPGALPPFGDMYGITTFVDKGLLKNNKIILNAGLFTASLVVRPKEYVRLAEAVLGNFSKAR